MIEICPFEPKHESDVVELILRIQRDEFGLSITEKEQPDLREVPSFYQSGKGEFFVAVSGRHVVGTVGLKDIGNGNAALRRMFVAESFRGRKHEIASRLLSRLLIHAAAQGISEIFLGTTEKFLAAHRFYEKHGFRWTSLEELPASFPRMTVDNKFYVRRCEGPTLEARSV